MKTLDELFADKEVKRVWFYIRREEQAEFLRFAKDNGCRWIDGTEIDLEGGACNFMGINRERKTGQISVVAWMCCTDPTSIGVRKMDFSEINEK